jgi:serine protease AprX
MSTFRPRLEPRRVVGVLIAALFAVTALLPAAAAPASATTGSVSVIVQKQEGVGNAPERLVEELGGTVSYDLSIINGFAASIDASQVRVLQQSNAIRHVSEDAPAYVTGLLGDLGSVVGGVTDVVDQTVTSTLDETTDALLPSQENPIVAGSADPEKVSSSESSSAVEPAPPTVGDGSVSVYQDEIGATDAHEAGYNGEGVTIALIDTGVAAIPDLQGRLVKVKSPNGNLKSCVDLSGEGNCNDSYGHGTFLAGLIAGSGAASNGEYSGVAPGAKILSVKLAGRDGSTSVGKLIYAIQWVTQYGPQYGVKVMNLSIGTDAVQSYRVDPLNYAVERAWLSGITVAVAAGNAGDKARTIAKPADDPLVLTTGAVDDVHSVSVSDDVIPTFTSRGPTAADGLTKPDITTPGSLLISTRSPNSWVEEKYPGGGIDATYRRGSGTSHAAAVLSGSIALLLQAHPNLTPNQVKYALTHSAQAIPASSDPNVVGAGLLNVGAAIADLPVGEANQGVQLSSGLGSLGESQGSFCLAVKDGSNVLGLLGQALPVKGGSSSDPSGLAWHKTSWYAGNDCAEWSGPGWYGPGWYGPGWYGPGWYGPGWYGPGWYGPGWYGPGWYGPGWYGPGWYGPGWYGFWS